MWPLNRNGDPSMDKTVKTTPGETTTLERQDSIFVNLARLLSLLALATSALVYPFLVNPNIMDRLYRFTQKFPGGSSFFEAIKPYLEFGFSPLTIKEVLTSWVLLALIGAWITWKLTASSSSARNRSHPGLLFLLLFLIWSVSSLAITPQFGIDSDLIYIAFDLTLWTLFFIAMTDLPGSFKFQRVAVWWIIGIGLILMLVSTGEAVQGISKYVFQFLPHIDDPYKRNLFGGLIGHNTGVASICMGPFFFAIGLFFATKRKIIRILLLLYIVIALYFFLVTQSRAVWILFALLTPPFLLGLRPIIGTPIRLRHFLIGLLLVILFVGSQLVPARWNFLHVEEAQFVDRLKAFTPKVLITETRLRILAVSLPLIAEKPILGHGLGSFVSVYPKACADYFSKYPNSNLLPTYNVTNQAHDDYLQLIIETGLLGFGLALTTGWLFFRRGLARFRRLKSSRDRLLRYCSFFALLEILLHGFVDFPFHIVPLATFFLFYCVLAYGGPEEDDATQSTSDNESREKIPTNPPRVASIRPAKVIALVIIFASWAALITAGTFATRRLLADKIFSQASHESGIGPKNETAAETEQRLLDARILFRDSLRIDPLAFDPRFSRALCDLRLALLYSEEAKSSQKQGLLPNMQVAHDKAVSMIRSSIDQFYQAGGVTSSTKENGGVIGSRINPPFLYNLAQAWKLVAELIPSAADEANRKALKYYQLTVLYAPAEASVITQLLNFMDQLGIDAPEQWLHYMGLLAKYERKIFLDIFMERISTLTNQERLPAVEILLTDMIHSLINQNDYPELYEALSQLYMVRGETDKFKDVLDEMSRKFPQSVNLERAEINYLLLTKKYEQAERMVTDFMAKNPQRNEALLFCQAELLARLGHPKEAKQLSEKTIRESTRPGEAYTHRAQVRLYLFGDRPNAMKDFAQAIHFYPAIGQDLPLLYVIRDQADRGDWKSAVETVALAKRRIPENPALKNLMDKLRQRPGGNIIPE